ncbi:MAG: DNA-binding transcriptional LysR family regulator [Psychromonas sp.]|jgi:DNA-binding transcriptional LysR family regulator|uniref:LysR family transcriptional regulator n=1 Tax=Psychromonas sp. TaxID=1884585 RepID=UPI0039E2833A
MNKTRLDSLPALALFALIVQYGSLSSAAQHSGLSRSAVSKQLSALEAKLGVRLLQRSTRSITLTEAGKQILAEARRILDALESVKTLSEDLQGEVCGHLKVSCSTGIGRVHVVPLLKQFRVCYPKVNVQLLLEDRRVDLIDEQIDVAIRVGHLPDSSLIALRLGEMTWVVCASPDYLRINGTPKTPTDLLQHDCLYYSNNQNSFKTWLFMGPNGEESISINGSLSLNDSTALAQAAEEGQGIVWIDKNSLGDALEKGRLVPVLEDYSLSPGYPIYALYPARRHLSQKTRMFVNFLSERFSPRMHYQ